MSWKHWTAVALVSAVGVGVGIALQVPRDDDGVEEHQRVEQATGSAAALDGAIASDDTEGPYRTIELEVTGLT